MQEAFFCLINSEKGKTTASYKVLGAVLFDFSLNFKVRKKPGNRQKAVKIKHQSPRQESICQN